MTRPKWSLERKSDGTYQAVRWRLATVTYHTTHSVRERRALRASTREDALRELEQLNSKEEE